jgi:hypothetical protein
VAAVVDGSMIVALAFLGGVGVGLMVAGVVVWLTDEYVKGPG